MLRNLYVTVCIAVCFGLAPALAQSPGDSARPVEPSLSEDRVPAPATPDPLTPQQGDVSPLPAPSVPTGDSGRPQAQADDAAVIALRARLEDWAEPRDPAERKDVAALKAFYGDGSRGLVWTAQPGFTERGSALMAALRRANAWGLDASAFEPPKALQNDALPRARAEAEIAISLSALKYARHARGGRLDPPSLSKMIDMRPRLYEPLSVLEGLAAAPSPDDYLEALNPKHAGFLALKAALAGVRSTSPATTTGEAKATPAAGAEMERRIVVNMERWRWLPDDLGQFYVWDNVPEQITRVHHDGKVVLKERIVVGKAGSPTPMFSAPMRFVIFHPSWGVPEGIKTNELAPMLRRAQSGSSGWFFSENDGASRALRRHELRVFHGGRELDPDRINWSSVDIRQFSFQQPPSAKNVLGVVKFRFPNRFDVYMHDTSERHLFSRASRTFSHGCMRVENPLKLAETILAYDKGWGRERIAQLVARGGTTDVTLDKNVPVHIVYFTATTDEAGKIHTHPDVYAIDSRIASALAGRSVVLASAKGEPDAGASPPARQGATRRDTQRREKAPRRPRQQDSFNPFAFLSAN